MRTHCRSPDQGPRERSYLSHPGPGRGWPRELESLVFARAICAMNPMVARSCWFPAVLIAGSLARAELGSVVINEIMYHPPRDLEQLQYVELFNAGKTERDLSGWSFSKGVKFVFPAN